MPLDASVDDVDVKEVTGRFSRTPQFDIPDPHDKPQPEEA
jgi:hypothetical protein